MKTSLQIVPGLLLAVSLMLGQAPVTPPPAAAPAAAAPARVPITESDLKGHRGRSGRSADGHVADAKKGLTIGDLVNQVGQERQSYDDDELQGVRHRFAGLLAGVLRDPHGRRGSRGKFERHATVEFRVRRHLLRAVVWVRTSPRLTCARRRPCSRLSAAFCRAASSTSMRLCTTRAPPSLANRVAAPLR